MLCVTGEVEQEQVGYILGQEERSEVFKTGNRLGCTMG